MTDPDCVFCKIVAGHIPSFKLFEDDDVFAFLDIAPFEKGHALLIPKHHAVYLTDLPEPVLARLMPAAKRVAGLLLARLPCDGFNILQNNGPCATQVVPHVHFHIVPRWNGRAVNWISGNYDSPDEIAGLHRRLTV